MLKYILLGFLNYSSMTGYDLKTRLEESTSHFWHAYHSQIYTALRKMDKEGLVASQMVNEEGSPTKREYTITDDGRAELLSWLQQSMTELPRMKEEMMVRLFFSGQRETEPLIDELRAQRQLHQQQLSLYESYDLNDFVPRAEDVMSRERFFWQRTLEFGKRYERLYLDWLDETIALIEQY